MDQKSDEARLAKMLTAISLQERTESASVERRFVPRFGGRKRPVIRASVHRSTGKELADARFSRDAKTDEE
jgi:hypothetical protein